MDDIPCLACGTFFRPRNKLQSYCSHPDCQKVRKAIWQRDQMKNNSEYQDNQKLSQQKWLANNPSYYREYRKNNPLKTQRNRLLQRVRNRKLHKKPDEDGIRIIAKMDAGKPFDFGIENGFWLVPVIAKMDARKFYFRLIPDG